MQGLRLPQYIKTGISRCLQLPINTNSSRFTIDSIDIETHHREILKCKEVELDISDVATRYILEYVFTSRTLPGVLNLSSEEYWSVLKSKSTELTAMKASDIRDYFLIKILPDYIRNGWWKFCLFRLISIAWYFNAKMDPEVVAKMEEEDGIVVSLDMESRIEGFSLRADLRATSETCVEKVSAPEKLFKIVYEDEENEVTSESGDASSSGGQKKSGEYRRFRFSQADQLEMVDFVVDKLKGQSKPPKTDAFWSQYAKKKSEDLLKLGQKCHPTPASCKRQFCATILPGIQNLPISEEKREELMMLMETVSRKRKGDSVGGDAKRKKN